MSTRAQIRFVDTYRNEDGLQTTIAQIYQHSDGYPSGVIQNLYELRELLKDTSSIRGAHYIASNYILLGKLQRMEFYLSERDYREHIDVESAEEVIDPDSWRDMSSPAFLLGFGVEDPAEGIHGDEEWIYVVDVSKSNWNVKISDKIPCDTDPENAFSRVEWEFNDVLDRACEKYLDSEVYNPM